MSEVKKIKLWKYRVTKGRLRWIVESKFLWFKWKPVTTWSGRATFKDREEADEMVNYLNR